MNIKTTISGLIVALSLIASSTSFAANACSWNLSQFSMNALSGSTTTGFNCYLNGTSISSKTVIVKASGKPSCNLNITNSGYTNKGTCETPSITLRSEVVRPQQCGTVVGSYCGSGGEAQSRAEVAATSTCAPCGGWDREYGSYCVNLRCK